MKNPVITFVVLALFAVTALFFACSQSSSTSKEANGSPKPQAPAGGAFKVEIKTDPVFVEAGKNVEISITIKNDKDEVVKDLPFTKDAPMHLISVSQDLVDLDDLILIPTSDGVFRVRHTFAAGGRYTFFLDLMTADGKVNTQILGFGIAGDPRPKQQLKADEKLVKTINDLRVEMKTDGEPAAGKPAILNFAVDDKNTNNPPPDTEELTRNAHFIIVSEDLKEFLHPEPVSGEAGSLGRQVTFPKGGLYKIWAQFQRGEKIVSVPFAVKVKAGEGEIDYSKIEIPKGAIRVTVSKEGFTPKAIEIKAGHQATLAFIRIDQENCGTQVNFPGLNITKDLPLGKVVTVEIPAEHPGEFNFACGMNMLKGIVMVE